MSSVAKQTKLEKEIAEVLNKYSEENRSNTADWILAIFLIRCLDAFNGAMFSREVQKGANPNEIIERLNKPREFTDL